MNNSIQKFDIGLMMQEKFDELTQVRGMSREAALALIDEALDEWRGAADGDAICCRHCGKPMKRAVQPQSEKHRAEGRKPIVYVTCEQDCPMRGYTFAESAYATTDLTDYLSSSVYKW